MSHEDKGREPIEIKLSAISGQLEELTNLMGRAVLALEAMAGRCDASTLLNGRTPLRCDKVKGHPDKHYSSGIYWEVVG